MRYAGQEHYVKIPLKRIPKSEKQLNSLIKSFHKAHKKQYTFELDTVVEWVNFHLVAVISVEKPAFPKLTTPKNKLETAIYAQSEVDFGKYGLATATIFERNKLSKDSNITGPAIIAEAATSTVLPPHFQLKVDDWGSLIITK